MPIPRLSVLRLWLTQEYQPPFDPTRSDGYDIVVVQEGRPIVFGPPAKQVGKVTGTGVPFTPGADGTRYVLAVRARTAAGYVGEPAVLLMRLVADSGELAPRPNTPTLRSVRPVAGGAVEVIWDYDGSDATVAVASFRILGDGGTGTLDAGSPLASVGSTARRAVIVGLTAGVRYLVAVQAVSAAGHADGNRHARAVVPRDSPPAGLGSGDLTAAVAG